MTICIIAVYLPVLLFFFLKKRIRQYDVGELSIMICELTIGMIGMQTLLTYYNVNSRWLIIILFRVYFTLYLNVMQWTFMFMLSVVKHIN